MRDKRLEFGNHREHEDDDSIGPFPPEPAPAPQGACPTCHGRGEVPGPSCDTTVCPTCDGITDPHTPIARWTKPEALHGVLLERHSLGEWVHWKDHIDALDSVERQRDELAGELEEVARRLRWVPVAEWGSIASSTELCELGCEENGAIYSRDISSRGRWGGMQPTVSGSGTITHVRVCLHQNALKPIEEALRKAGRS